MRQIIGAILILAGAGLFLRGYVLEQSLRGATQRLGAHVHAAWSGRLPVTPAMECMLAGGLLVAGGAGAVLKK